EWSFGDVNPPVHAWAALRVYEIDGSRDHEFLERVLHKLLLNFTWWVNRKDAGGNNVFEGGFLGLDNIGPIDRSAQIPANGVLEQSDGTSWMALFCLNLLEISIRLAQNDPTYTDLATKFFEHFAYVASAIYEQGLWDDEDGFYYDVLRSGDGHTVPLRVRSFVGLLPLCATTALRSSVLDTMADFAFRFHWFVANKPQYAERISRQGATYGTPGYLLSIVGTERLVPMLARMLDEQEFLSPHGLRSLSAQHRDAPFTLHVNGMDAT